MTKYRFTRGPDGTITVRAQRVLGKQLVASITRVVAPGEDISAAMKLLHAEVQAAGKIPSPAQVRASERGVQ